MEMNLDQIVLPTVDRDRTAFAVICLNGMAVIDELQRCCGVGELDSFEFSWFGGSDVDRRLAFAILAGGVIRFQIALSAADVN